MHTVPRTEPPDLTHRERRALAEALKELRQRRTALNLRALLRDVFGDHEAVALESEVRP